MLDIKTNLETTNFWRNELKAFNKELEASFHQKPNPAIAIRKHARFVDNLLCILWKSYNLDTDTCLIAAGGYGRSELFPHSDVDILILTKDDVSIFVKSKLETLIGVLWDIGLAIGHSVRTVDDCLEESSKDVTVQTNLLESRFLYGNKCLYENFEKNFLAELSVETFFQKKIREQKLRHAKYNDTAYNLEPNIKESPGGLRDLQSIMWIARSLGLGKNWADLVQNGFLSLKEAREIRSHELKLQSLRIRLHYISKRREDRLLFDYQNDLASSLGLTNNTKKRASEQLMHSYFKTVKFVEIANEILVQLLGERINNRHIQIEPIDEIFTSRNQLLDISSDDLIQKNPSLILKSFLVLQRNPQLSGMSSNLLRTLLRSKKLVDKNFRNNPKNNKIFVQILSEPNGVTESFRRMNRYGILGEYIPMFGKIIGQMQHDLFHVYTVDEHILNVLGNLRRLSITEHSHEFPLCSKLFSQFDKPHLLYLAAIFHDIAKGRGGDHSTLGATDAFNFCKKHQLSDEDSKLVAWLVESHLMMSSVAQKSDLSDPSVIEVFAKKMGDERHLVALYLLTVADIRGTSPNVWNAWKAKLLENLFQNTKKLLKGSDSNCIIEVDERQVKAKTTLNHYGISPSSYKEFWAQLNDSYFLRHQSQEIAWHTRLLLPHLDTQLPIVRARLSPDGDGIQVMIYTIDRDDLFSRICNFFDRMGYNILEAKIHTTKHNYALDSFLVADQSTKSVVYRNLMQFIEHELAKKLSSEIYNELPYQGRLNRQVKLMPITTKISIQAEGNIFHNLEITSGDQPGLLSKLAQTFLSHEIQIHTAKINTLGNRIEDSFLISRKNYTKLSLDQINEIKYALTKIL